MKGAGEYGSIDCLDRLHCSRYRSVFLDPEGVERQNVRDCLEQSSRQYGIGNQHHVYLTDVIQVEVHPSYGDGTATRFVKYQLQGSSEIQSTTCRW